MKHTPMICALVTLLLFFSLIPLAGCAAPPGSQTDTLVSDLKGAGAEVALGSTLQQSFFSVEARILKVNGEEVQVFEYPYASTANAQAARVSNTGSTIGTSMISWVNTPHFFKKGGLIVLYVGKNQSILDALKKTLGEQFAGG
jgi:membrane-associated protease RseP (regulator of RpoE activity)